MKFYRTLAFFARLFVWFSSSCVSAFDTHEKYAFFIVCGGTPEVFRSAKTVVDQANQKDRGQRFAYKTCFKDRNETARWMSDLISTRTYVDVDKGEMKVGGFAFSVATPEPFTPVINKAVDSGIPVVTFATDAPNSKRVAYVGTNNTFFGDQLAKALFQVKPHGGTFAVVGSPGKSFDDRLVAFYAALSERGNWREITGSPLIADFNGRSAAIKAEKNYRLMQQLSDQNPTAIVAFQGFIIDESRWVNWVDYNRWRNITYICADSAAIQISLLYSNHVHGLVGQMPSEMGYQAMAALLDIFETNSTHVRRENIGTNVITHTRIPYVLPPLEVDHNLIGDLKFVGYTCFAIVALSCCAAMGWVYCMSSVYVVEASQPIFLVMIAGGILIMSSSLIPMSMEDSTNLHQHNGGGRRNIAICMSIPWLAFVGFSTCFSALLSKTWRINLILKATTCGFQRVQISERDVMIPFVLLLTANILILIVWTVRDPLTYVRNAHAGRDEWERVISTYGTCHSNNVIHYLIPLTIVNTTMLLFANWQAYRARHLESEFAESRSIGMVMASMMQAIIMGIPVLFIVSENPPAYYLILVSLTFVVSMTALLLIFVPKIVFAELFRGQTPEEQAMFIQNSLQLSTVTPKSSRRRAESSDEADMNLFSSSLRPPRGTLRRSSSDDMVQGVLVIDKSHVATIQENNSHKEDDEEEIVFGNRSSEEDNEKEAISGKESKQQSYVQNEEAAPTLFEEEPKCREDNKEGEVVH